MALEQITKEYEEMQKDPISSFSVGLINKDDMFNWRALLVAPSDTPYVGGYFSLTIHFTPDYPLKPPEVRFKTKIYHPNIINNISINLDNFQYDHWSLAKVVHSIISLLRKPNFDDALVPEISDMYINDPAKYEMTARIWTRVYATG